MSGALRPPAIIDSSMVNSVCRCSHCFSSERFFSGRPVPSVASIGQVNAIRRHREEHAARIAPTRQPLMPPLSNFVRARGESPEFFKYSLSMYQNQIPSVWVTNMRRSGTLMPELDRVSVALKEDDGALASSDDSVARIGMRSGVIFLEFLFGACRRRAQVLRLHSRSCGRCAGLHCWCKPAVRRAHVVDLLKAKGKSSSRSLAKRRREPVRSSFPLTASRGPCRRRRGRAIFSLSTSAARW